MLRVTRNGFSDLISNELGRLNGRLRVAEEQAATGRKVNRPSDAPQTIAEAHRLYSSIEDQDVYQTNSQYAQGFLDIMDNALSSAQDIIVRAREIAVAMAGDTVTAGTRSSAATEVTELYTQMLDVANTDMSGRYVFAGSMYTTQPFNNAGVYQGDNNTPATKVGDSQWVQTGYDGSQVFASTVDIFVTLNNLITGLQTNNSAAISTALGDLDLSTTQLSTWRSTIGSETNSAEDAQAVAENISQVLSQRLEEVINVEPTTAYTKLNDLRNAYAATLQVSASATRVSLFDLL